MTPNKDLCEQCSWVPVQLSKVPLATCCGSVKELEMACLQTGEVGSMALGSQGKSKKHAAAGGGRREEGTSDTSYGPPRLVCGMLSVK